MPPSPTIASICRQRAARWLSAGEERIQVEKAGRRRQGEGGREKRHRERDDAADIEVVHRK